MFFEIGVDSKHAHFAHVFAALMAKSTSQFDHFLRTNKPFPSLSPSQFDVRNQKIFPVEECF